MGEEEAGVAGGNGTSGRGNRWASLGIVVAAAAVAFWFGVWPRGGLGFVQDEHAYLFQADTLLQGRLALPPPPVPEAFEAPHLLVEPRYAAKYYPGHALLLAPFRLAEAAWVWPCLAFGVVAALCFRAARQSDSGWAALAAPACLVGSGPLLVYFPTFLAHSSAAVLALGALTLAGGRRRREALAVGCLLGLLLLTRPLSAIAASLAVAPSVLGRRHWQDRACFAAPIVVAAAVAAVVNWRVTGDVMLPPWLLWAQEYAPFDGPGIGSLARVEPLRPLPPHFAYVVDRYWATRSAYTWSALPGVALERLRVLATFLPSPQVALLAGAGLGLLWRPGPARRIVVFGLLLFLLQLTFHATLAQYSVEIAPIWAVLVAFGIATLVRLWQRGPPRTQAAVVAVACALELAAYRWFFGLAAVAAFPLLFLGASGLLAAIRGWPARAARVLLLAAACGLVAAAVPGLGVEYRRYVGVLRSDWDQLAAFDHALQPLRDRPALVLVRYRLPVELHLPIANPRLWRGEPGLVVAVEREPYSSELVERLPDHAPFIWDAAGRVLLRRTASPAR